MESGCYRSPRKMGPASLPSAADTGLSTCCGAEAIQQEPHRHCHRGGRRRRLRPAAAGPGYACRRETSAAAWRLWPMPSL